MSGVKKLLTLFIASTVLASSSLAVGQNAPLQGFNEYAEKAMKDWEVPGVAIAVVKDDSMILARGYGVRELGKQRRVDEHTLFAIASNTKAFTAAALGILVHEGKLDWDDPAANYLPELQLYDPYVTRELTVRDLLCHRSGLQKWGGDLIWFGSNRSIDEVLHQVRYIRPFSSFRSEFGYCNLMFVAAGQIIRAVSGESWDDFVKYRIFEPLGMTRSCTSVRDLAIDENVASPHTRIEGKIAAIPYRNIDNAAPAGSINSSVIELAQWLRMQLGHGVYNGKQVIDSTTIQEMRTPQTIIKISSDDRKLFPTTHFRAYGLGWFLSDYYGRLVISHGGGLDGMFSRVGLLPEEKLGIAILTNLDDHSLMTALFYRLIDAYLGLPERDWNTLLLDKHKREKKRAIEKEREMEKKRAKKASPCIALREIEGAYANEIIGEAEIIKQEKQLILKLASYPDIQGFLEHWSHETFTCKWNDPTWGKSYLTFVPDGRGSVEGFKVKVREDFIDPLEYIFNRVSE